MDDETAIAETVRLYVEGMCGADAEKLRQAMHERACSIGHFDGGLEWDDRERFIAGVEAVAETPAREPYWRILSVIVDGDVATVRVEDDWLGMRFTDALTLLKHEGRWVIAAKVFYHHAA